MPRPSPCSWHEFRSVHDAVRVRPPATSANLGPGFDALGLALTLYDELTVQVTGEGLRVEVTGMGAAHVARDETHLVVRAMLATFDELGGRPPGLALHCVNRIPHGRGLGSSAAAIVGGVLAARALVEGGSGALSDQAALALASRLEGHPDNVAACLLGGVTVAWTEGSAGRAVRLTAVESLVPVLFVAPDEASTAQVRRLLPSVVPHADAAFAAGRSALLVAALTARPDVLLAATEDVLHQRYRVLAMPDTANLVAGLRATGAPAVVSGAGPSVLVLARGAAEVEDVLAHAPADWDVRALGIAVRGAADSVEFGVADVRNTPGPAGVAEGGASV